MEVGEKKIFHKITWISNIIKNPQLLIRELERMNKSQDDSHIQNQIEGYKKSIKTLEDNSKSLLSIV